DLRRLLGARLERVERPVGCRRDIADRWRGLRTVDAPPGPSLLAAARFPHVECRLSPGRASGPSRRGGPGRWTVAPARSRVAAGAGADGAGGHRRAGGSLALVVAPGAGVGRAARRPLAGARPRRARDGRAAR